MARNRKLGRAWRYWGYLPFAAALLGWLNPQVGPVVIILLVALSTFYFLFQVPIPCGAATRDGSPCRNNASGLLFGCHFQDHKLRKLAMLGNLSRGREFVGSLWSNWKRAVPALAESATIVSGIAAVVALFLG